MSVCVRSYLSDRAPSQIRIAKIDAFEWTEESLTERLLFSGRREAVGRRRNRESHWSVLQESRSVQMATSRARIIARFLPESGTSEYQKPQNQCGVRLAAECSVAALVS
jgi:hypothetical protein